MEFAVFHEHFVTDVRSQLFQEEPIVAIVLRHVREHRAGRVDLARLQIGPLRYFLSDVRGGHVLVRLGVTASEQQVRFVITAQHGERAGTVVFDFEGGNVPRQEEVAGRGGVGKGASP